MRVCTTSSYKTKIHVVSDKSYQDTQLALQVAQNARNIKNQVKINLVRTHVFNMNVTLVVCCVYKRCISFCVLFLHHDRDVCTGNICIFLR